MKKIIAGKKEEIKKGGKERNPRSREGGWFVCSVETDRVREREREERADVDVDVGI